MRGKASTLKTSRRFPGITPAYAGKSYQYPNPVQHKQDHPRVCGEKFGCRCPLDSQRGSPPRMRGKASAGNAVESITGITPAYAGKRFRSSTKPAQSGDHPRVCGEKFTGDKNKIRHVGSPPRMRGKVSPPISTVSPLRITPAYAGKSKVSPSHGKWDEDHPRVCGEKQILPIAMILLDGITPAYAGKSCTQAVPLSAN